MKKQVYFELSVYCLLGILVFLFFSHTIGYPWRYYDEKIIYDETILPIPKTFSEIFQILTSLGLNNHFEASNPIYSNISNIRGTPIDVIFNLFIFWLFQKSAYAYHLFSLVLHVLNTCLCFYILKKTSGRYIIPFLLTLLWALHPANIESVVFATNYGALITYFFCFLFLAYFTEMSSVIFFIFCLIPLFLNEYAVTMPFILFFYLFATNIHYKKSFTLRQSFFKAVEKTLPAFCALLVFVLYFLSIPKVKTDLGSNLVVILERIFWFSPQIFFHYIKLIFYPHNLSIDQSAFVQFSPSLLGTYALFCMLLMFGLILFSFISVFFIKRNWGFLFLMVFVPFFLSILPFLHILSPVYNIASERYLYFPSFILILGISTIIASRGSWPAAPTITILICILCVLATRSYIRTLDWKNSFTLLSSAVEIAPDNLFKGMRQQMISTSMKVLHEGSQEDIKKYNELAKFSLIKAINNLKKEKETNTPAVLRFYGLDSETLLAKAVFLFAFCENEAGKDPYTILGIFNPYLNTLPSLDTTILNFYYRILFFTKNFDAAEKILYRNLSQNRISPSLFVALSDLQEYKYNNLTLTKKYLDLSYKYFPYDSVTLFGLQRFYSKVNDQKMFEHFSYLYSLRTGDKLVKK